MLANNFPFKKTLYENIIDIYTTILYIYTFAYTYLIIFFLQNSLIYLSKPTHVGLLVKC